MLKQANKLANNLVLPVLLVGFSDNCQFSDLGQ